MKLRAGDVVALDLGTPSGREAGFARPAVVVSAQRILDAGPAVVQVVPLTRTLREFRSEPEITPDDANGLTAPSVAQCQHIRAVAMERVTAVLGNVGPAALLQVREVLALLLDLPG